MWWIGGSYVRGARSSGRPRERLAKRVLMIVTNDNFMDKI